MNKKFFSYLCLILPLLLWGLSFIATKVALNHFSLYSLLFLRFFIAAVCLLPILIYKGFPTFKLKEQALLFLISFLQPGLYFFLATSGIKRTSASEASLILALVPITVLLFSSLLYKEKITTLKIFAILLSIMGVLLLIGKSIPFFNKNASLAHNYGNLFMLAAVFVNTIYILKTKKLTQSFSIEYISFAQFFYASLLFFPFAYSNLIQISIHKISSNAIVALLFISLGGSLTAFFSYNYALSKISASKAAVWMNTIPLVTVFFSYFVLAEQLGSFQLLGAFFILLSVYLTSIKKIKFNKN